MVTQRHDPHMEVEDCCHGNLHKIYATLQAHSQLIS